MISTGWISLHSNYLDIYRMDISTPYVYGYLSNYLDIYGLPWSTNTWSGDPTIQIILLLILNLKVCRSTLY